MINISLAIVNSNIDPIEPLPLEGGASIDYREEFSKRMIEQRYQAVENPEEFNALIFAIQGKIKEFISVGFPLPEQFKKKLCGSLQKTGLCGRADCPSAHSLAVYFAANLLDFPHFKSGYCSTPQDECGHCVKKKDVPRRTSPNFFAHAGELMQAEVPKKAGGEVTLSRKWMIATKENSDKSQQAAKEKAKQKIFADCEAHRVENFLKPLPVDSLADVLIKDLSPGSLPGPLDLSGRSRMSPLLEKSPFSEGSYASSSSSESWSRRSSVSTASTSSASSSESRSSSPELTIEITRVSTPSSEPSSDAEGEGISIGFSSRAVSPYDFVSSTSQIKSESGVINARVADLFSRFSS